MAVLEPGKKYCKYCGEQIPVQAVVCPMCGGQVEKLESQSGAQASAPQVIVTNVNNNTNTNVGSYGREKNKWIAFFLCFFFGILGAHRFYEGKIGTGILYIFTLGLFGIGWFIDLIIILCKPVTYYV